MKSFLSNKTIIVDQKKLQGKHRTKLKRLDNERRIPLGEYCSSCGRPEGRVHESNCQFKDNSKTKKF